MEYYDQCRQTENKLAHVVILSGDSDFSKIITFCEKRQIEITFASFFKCMSYDLKVNEYAKKIYLDDFWNTEFSSSEKDKK